MGDAPEGTTNSQPYDERLLSTRRSNRLSLGHLAHVQFSQLYLLMVTGRKGSLVFLAAIASYISL
jgi:hypothetical protein